jgi:malate dehydrogenase (oxaloacetate-decarboxylating)(NADP+)
LDVGTDNEKFLADPDYPGLRQKRVRGEEYDRFIENFMKACRKKLAQNIHILKDKTFKDLAKKCSFNLRILAKIRPIHCFNDSKRIIAHSTMIFK